MDFSTALRYYLMIAPHVLLLGVSVLMARRGLYRRFPFFFTYTIWEVVQFAVGLSLILSPSTTPTEYAVEYSVALAGSTLLRFGILYEVFRHFVLDYSIFERVGKPLFSWLGAGLLFTAVLLGLYTSGNAGDHLLYVIHVLDRTAAIMQCGLLLGIFALTAYLSLSWRTHVFGIALGVGIVASVELAAAALRAQLSFANLGFVDYLTMGAYHFTVVLWMIYLWAPERTPQYTVKAMPEHDLETWNQELQRLIRQ